MSEPATETEHPRRMLDRYEIIAEIARGGMGTVLLARLEGAGGFERLMAIKLMHEHLAQDPSFVTMLLDEARTAANIHHPNAVGIVDVAESPVGYYLVMSYVEGFTLAQLVSHPSLDAKQRIRLGLRVLIDACRGLHAAHTAKDAKGKPLGIVHRDVSPQNVLVGLDGVGRIVDFGIALAASRVTASRPGVLKGKPSYMAPEQVQGQPCDARADVFALGIVLWEILTGSRLFEAEMELATLLQVVEAKVEPPSQREPLATPELDAVVLAALERVPDRRTSDARALAVAIERAADAAGLLAPTHEVADAIERLFAREIEERQEAIRHHLATSVGEKKPLVPGQLGLIPRLYDRTPAPRSTELQNRSGVRERDVSYAPTRQAETPIRTLALETPVMNVEPPVIEPPATPREEPRRARWPIAAVAIGVLAIGGAGAWAVATSGGEPDGAQQPAERPANEEPAALEPVPEAVAAPELVEPAPEPAEAAPEPAEAASEPAEVVPEPAEAAPEPTAREPRSARQRPRPHEDERPRENRTPTETPTEEAAPRTPALESNPYLVR